MDKKIRQNEKIRNNKLNDLYESLYREIELELIRLTTKYSNGQDITMSDLNKANRYRQFKDIIFEKIKFNHGKIQNYIISDLTDIFKNTFYDTLNYVSEQIGYSIGDVFLNEDLIEEALNHKINKLTLVNRLEKNRNIILKETTNVIARNLVLGTGINEISKGLRKIYGNDKVKTTKIARTETTRIFNSSKNKAYQQAHDMGIEFKEMWLATPNSSRTRDMHLKLHKTFKNEDGYYVIGRYKAKHPGDFGVAEMDINCRCTTIAVFD